MAEVKFQPSQKVESFFSEDLGNDSERFLLFLKGYYEWLQTAKITFTGLSDTFERDEVITGSISGATATIKEVGTDYIVVLVTSRLPFDIGETITGGTSSATATVSTVKENVVRGSGNLLNNRYIETSIDQYQDYLKSELYATLPKEYLGDKRQIALKFKTYFESKSNEESYRFLFRLLYNEPIEFYYPGEDILRPSDGNYEKTNIIRVIYTDDVFDFLEKTIRGKTSGSLANVVDVKSFFVGGLEIAELTLKLVSGPFLTLETIEDIDNPSLITTVYGIVSSVTVNDGGSGYEVGDAVSVTGDGSEAEARVSSVSDAPISSLVINEYGHGYRLNTEATIDNSGTGGSGLLVRVTGLANTYSYTDANTSTTYTLGEVSRIQILNRGSGYVSAPGITLRDSVISDLGLLSAELITIVDGGSDYGVGNTLIFTGGSGANAAGQVAAVEESTTYDFLFEDGFRMLSEDSYYDIIKNEDWESIGPIARVELTNFGDGYTVDDLPTITVDTTTGSSANIIATNIQGRSANLEVDVANNIVGIGAIRAVEITNFGINYTSATADASGAGDGNANLTINISGLGIKEGNWVDDDGKLNYKFIQDSFYYQDYSYVIKSGLAFSFYKDTVKSIIHPAGLQPFGQILISSTFDVSPNFITIIDSTRVMERLVSFLLEASVSAAVTSQNQYIVELNPVSPAVIETDREVNIEIPLEAQNNNLNAESSYEVESQINVEVPATVASDYKFGIAPLIPSTLTSDREVQVEYTNAIDTSTNTVTRYVIDVTPNVSFAESFAVTTKTVKNYKSFTSAAAGYAQNRRTYLWSETPIETYSSGLLSAYANTVFGDVGVEGSIISLLVKLPGTVSMDAGQANVVGYNTTFKTSIPRPYDYFVIDNAEKFIINREGLSFGALLLLTYGSNTVQDVSDRTFDENSVFSNTFISMIQNAENSYANVAGYREVL